MSFFKPCGVCAKRKFYIKKRSYKVKAVKDPIVSKKEMCGKCFKNIGTMLTSSM